MNLPAAKPETGSPDSTITAALRQATNRLGQAENPGLDAQILLAHVLDKPRSYLLAWPERTLSAEQQRAFRRLVERRDLGEPVAYLTGYRQFWSLEFEVGPATLVPRAETEHLVELALSLLPPDKPGSVADLGTGCGAIAAAIASERPLCQITLTERSAPALRLAKRNFERLGLRWTHMAEGDWCNALPPDCRFDLIVSNPPYIAEGDPELEPQVLAHEPALALMAGPDGLDALRSIVRQAPAHLLPGGALLLEHGFNQAKALRNLLLENGFSNIRTQADLAGHDRVSGGIWPGPR